MKWIEGDLEAALAAAKAEGKLVFVDVGAYWCPPCRELEEKVFTRDDVGAALSKYVALHVDAEKGEGPELVARYKVQAYPTLLVLDANGVEKGRLVDAMEPPALLAALEKIAAGGDVLAELEQKVAAAPDDLQARYELGVAYALAAKRAQAEAEFERVIAGDPDNAKGLAAKAMSDRAAFLVAKIDGDSERAIALYKELQQKYPAAKESIRAFRAIGRELHKLGRDDEAIESLKAMVASDQNNNDLKRLVRMVRLPRALRPGGGARGRRPGGGEAARQRRAVLLAGRAAAPARARRGGRGGHPRGGPARARVGLLQAPGAALH
ncbi:tetratricopeptide repeat protein [Nannocystis pusilla]|uniref:thioredoxin family protein n=1 Tax=Nannocystis pusilla TaxID=889268 RepID=UPI003DA3E799